MAKEGWIKPVIALIVVVVVGIVISNSISTGNVVNLIDPDAQCNGVDGASGKVIINENSRNFEGLKADSKASADNWLVQNIDECKRQQDQFIEKCGSIFGDCKNVGNSCREIDDRKTYNCVDYIPEHQNCEIISETAYRSTWNCTIERIEEDLGSCTCKQ